MCGRYSLTTPVEALRRLFGFLELPNLEPRYNIAPTQQVLAVRLGDDGARHAVVLRWGLIPAWAKDAAIGNRLINARAETAAEKAAFRSAMQRRRCLIACDGFYEWRHEGGGKQPYRIVLSSGGPFAFAGLWERWHRDGPGQGEAIESCTILTTEACPRLQPIHLRMPVIVEPADYQAWLDTSGPPAATGPLLRPYRDTPEAGYGELAFYPVSRRVNAVANDDAEVIVPLTPGGTAPEQPRLL